MKIYRVFERQPYSEGDPDEYGYYSSNERAIERLNAIWTERSYPVERMETLEFGGRAAKGLYEWKQINVQEIELDKDLN